MSKIGKLPIAIPQGVKITVDNRHITVVGEKGQLEHDLPKGINLSTTDHVIEVKQAEETKDATRALFGLTRALINNMVTGVSKGFDKRLEMSGVGYRAQATGSDLVLSVGFSHPVKFKAPQGVTFSVDGNTIIVAGIDKTLIGDIAAKIRAVRKPEPYKGKGIKYVGEHIRRKAGKAAKAVGGK